MHLLSLTYKSNTFFFYLEIIQNTKQHESCTCNLYFQQNRRSLEPARSEVDARPAQHEQSPEAASRERALHGSLSEAATDVRKEAERHPSKARGPPRPTNSKSLLCNRGNVGGSPPGLRTSGGWAPEGRTSPGVLQEAVTLGGIRSSQHLHWLCRNIAS